MRNKITLLAYAKLNLYLDITGKREDGFHEIEGVMQAIDLHDTVTVHVTDEPGIFVTCNNPEVPTDNTNVAYRAAELFLRESNLSFGVEINIKNQIPDMAGLGGSSADGAAVMQALNILSDYFFEERELLKKGAELGADIPFCIMGGTAFYEGMGDILAPLPEIENVYYVIVQPDYKSNTKEAYAFYDRRTGGEFHTRKEELGVLVDSIKNGTFLKNAKLMYNVFHDGASSKICRKLLDLGANGAVMTGSGSAVFGVFTNFRDSLAAYGKLDYPFKYIACNAPKNNIIDTA